jgi:uncharacterized protein
MALICDTGGVYALYDADDTHHATARAVVEVEPGPLYLPVVLLVEIDYLLTTRLGVDAALDFVQSIEGGAFALVALDPTDLARCRELIVQYRDLSLGLADASVVATAERLNVGRLLTVDQRHFRAVRPRGLGHFTLLPADRG